eukprot:EG_transcript_7595
MSYYPTASYSYTSAPPASYAGSYGGPQRTYVGARSEPYQYSSSLSGSTQSFAARAGGPAYSTNVYQPTYQTSVSTSQGPTASYGIPAAQNLYTSAASAASRPSTQSAAPRTGYTTSAATATPLRTVVQQPQQGTGRAPAQPAYVAGTAQTQPRPAATSTGASTSTTTTVHRQPIQVPLSKPVKPAAAPTKVSHADDDVVEITTPAAKALGEEIIDADRDKVFDALFDAQEKAEESLVQQVQQQLMITGPPSEAQAERMQQQAEQRFLRIPLEKVWTEFARQHKGQAVTEDEHCELVRCFITANKRWSTSKNEEGKQQMAMQMAAMGLPPGLAHMMTAMTDNLVGGLEQTLYEKMSSNYQLIAKAVWAQLQKDAHGLVPKKAFMDKFLDVFSDVVDKGLEKALKSGELDAALGPLASSGPVIMVAAIPMDEMMGLGAGNRGPLMLGAPPEMHSLPRQAAHTQPSYGSSYPHPSASAYGASGLPQYTTLPSQGAYGYGGNPYAAQAPAAPHLPSYAAPAQGYHPGYASQMYSRPY